MIKFLFLFSILIQTCIASDETWLKGDLHVHTHHSGGDASVRELSDLAQALSLDFIAITDHDDKMNGIPRAWDEITELKKSKTQSALLLYGMEWTHGINWFTARGHMNIWSDREFDYREIWRANLENDPFRAQRLALELGALYSINHPKLFGFEWEYKYPKNPPSIEIWNGAFRLGNSRATIRDVWSKYLNQGVSVTAVGGSDTHDIHKKSGASLGNPTTWVRVREKSAGAVLQAIREGKTAISYSPFAPTLTIQTKKSENKTTLTLSWIYWNPSQKLPLEVVLYKNGGKFKSWKISTPQDIQITDLKPRNARAWYYAEVHGETGFKGKKRLAHGQTISISNAVILKSDIRSKDHNSD